MGEKLNQFINHRNHGAGAFGLDATRFVWRGYSRTIKSSIQDYESRQINIGPLSFIFKIYRWGMTLEIVVRMRL